MNLMFVLNSSPMTSVAPSIVPTLCWPRNLEGGVFMTIFIIVSNGRGSNSRCTPT